MKVCNRLFWSREERGIMTQQKEPIKKPKQKPDTKPDWGGKCEVCGASPIVPATGMCGPCTFGEAETAGGNW